MILISLATGAGAPLHADCTDCHQTWDRAYDDPDAFSFTEFVRTHLRTGRPRDPLMPRVRLADVLGPDTTGHDHDGLTVDGDGLAEPPPDGEWVAQPDLGAAAEHLVRPIRLHIDAYVAIAEDEAVDDERQDAIDTLRTILDVLNPENNFALHMPGFYGPEPDAHEIARREGLSRQL